MAEIKLKGNPIHTKGELPAVGSTASDFTMIKNDLSETTLHAIKGFKYKVLNIFPSIDTGTCATSVRQFNKKSAELGKAFILNLSVDLPFAQKRFCGAEGIDKTETFSLFRSDFLKNYKLDMTDGPLKGLCSRAIILLDENNKVLYTEQVSDIVNEPNYDKVISHIK